MGSSVRILRGECSVRSIFVSREIRAKVTFAGNSFAFDVVCSQYCILTYENYRINVFVSGEIGFKSESFVTSL